MVALILAGHGSHISPHTAGVVWRCVDRLRALGAADEVTACFWKEPPSFHHVFETVASSDIIVVPVFTAQGYFTQTVIPAEMGLSGTITLRGGRTIRYSRTLGEHPYVSQIVRQRVEAVLEAENLDADRVAVAVIGHGTRRSAQSREATRRQVDYLRAAEIAAEVIDVYLDDTPGIADAFTLTSAPVLIAVPFFLAPGSHTTFDVPEALGIAPGESAGIVGGRQVFYTSPVGTDEALTDLILELAHDAGMPQLNRKNHDDPWGGFPTVGRDSLIKAVYQRGCLVFGQLLLTPDEVCPVEHPGEGRALTTPEALRAYVRENPFRPLPTAHDLPGGWRVPVRPPEQLHAVVETIYPGAVADWAASQQDVFLPSTLAATAARQTGMYRDVRQAEAGAAVEQVCGGCVRYPTWYYGDLLP
ncbi:MAG: hypothetical protein K8I30_15415, partial [Anaerolineae bacterium]|nr:hypothetical protein [Anaerolineae bacterium]